MCKYQLSNIKYQITISRTRIQTVKTQEFVIASLRHWIASRLDRVVC
ncbi:MAG: hypothetical protein LBM98_02125 [Oscillospiraceae bacterium]|nr:hypothetical protein [Oscillospiraceae bacterium]